MKILMIGDIVGRQGRMAMARIATRYKAEGRADAVIANAENSAAGRGITAELAEELFAGGADALTMGDHVWDQKDSVAYYDREPRIIRALNLPPGCRPWRDDHPDAQGRGDYCATDGPDVHEQHGGLPVSHD